MSEEMSENKQIPAPSAARGARWRAHISVRLLIVVELLAALVLAKTPGAPLVELSALITLSARRRLPASLLVVSLLTCVGLEALLLLAPGEPALLLGALNGLTLPAAWADSLRGALALAEGYPPAPLVASLALGGAKVVGIALVIAWFGALTDTSELLDFFALGSRIPGLRSPLYILSTLLATLPSIETDVHKSLDAAIIRGGGRDTLLSPRTWANALTDTIVRVIVRSERLASSAIARGFRLRDGLTPVARRRFTLADGLLAVGVLGLGGLLYEVIR